MTESHIKHTACNRDCPDACGLVATVEGNRVVRLQGDQDHPITKGFLCHRTSRFLERQYDSERLLTPLRRRGNDVEEISWDEALDLVAETMLRVRSESGGAAILHYRCGGSLGMMKLVTDYFFEKFGPVTIKSGDICTGAGDAAQHEDFGDSEAHDLFDLLNSKTILLWGKNPYVSHVHLLPILKEAQAGGAQIVLIDPVHHRTANLCDRYLQPRPGGDMALALGVARTLFERGTFDPSAPTYCDHVDDFRQFAFSRTMSEWSRLSDIPAADIEWLAEAYADRPSAIMVGWGMQRRANGCATIRTIDALGAISGNLGIPGGGVSFYFKRRGAFDLSFVQGLEAAPRSIPEPLMGPGILSANDPPVRMVWVTAANPVAMLPDSRTVARALESRELTVVVDSFLTDTARCAHLVLPTRTMLEEDDLLGAYGHHWLIESQPVVAPPPGVRSDYEIVQQLAERVGLADCFSDEVEQWKRKFLRPVSDLGASLERLRSGPVRNPLSEPVLFGDRHLATASGRVNLICGAEVEPPRTTAERPMLLMSLSSERAQGSQWVHAALQERLTATVHPSAAAGFAEGESVLVESELGAMEVRLRFDPRQRPDVLLIPKGGWLSRGQCGNALIPARLSDAGGCAALHDTPVRLRRLE